jgi:hypothetical protein
MPASKIKAAGWHFDYRNMVGSGATGDYTKDSQVLGMVQEGGAYTPQNVVVLTGTTGTTSAVSATLVNGANKATAALTGSDALAIDTKSDDGKANTGKIRGLNPAGTSGTCYTDSTSTAVDYVTSSATAKVCALTFQVDPKSN